MYTTQLDNGLINNYAVEPNIYYAAFPSPEQLRNYAIQGVFATIFVVALTLVASAVS